jgi:Fe2+ or Zn2+ uptake regulation protein
VADVKTEGIPESGLKGIGDCGFNVEGYSAEFFGLCADCQGIKS